MTAGEYFKRATIGERVSKYVFLLVLIFSSCLLIPRFGSCEEWLETPLIPLAIFGILLSMYIRCSQNAGNSAQRSTQLTNSFAVPLGDAPRDGYYNNPVPPSIYRLAATTLENATFTAAILERMLLWCRMKFGLYMFVFIMSLIFRDAALTWLLLLAQTLFSADITMRWMQMERYFARTKSAESTMRQFFIHLRGEETSPSPALTISAFTDYECAKDEAAMPLDGEIFKKLNPIVSARWEKLREELGINEIVPPS